MSDNTINLSELQTALPELEALWQNKDDATLAYSAGIDAVSVKCGISKWVLRQLVTARKKDKTAAAREESQDLADVIEALDGTP